MLSNLAVNRLRRKQVMLTVGILQGVLVAVILSLVNVFYYISRPHAALLDDMDTAFGTVYLGVTD